MAVSIASLRHLRRYFAHHMLLHEQGGVDQIAFGEKLDDLLVFGDIGTASQLYERPNSTPA